VLLDLNNYGTYLATSSFTRMSTWPCC